MKNLSLHNSLNISFYLRAKTRMLTQLKLYLALYTPELKIQKADQIKASLAAQNVVPDYILKRKVLIK